MFKFNKKLFCKVDHPFKIFEKRYEDLPRSNRPLPKRESLLLYRDVIRACKKFYWRSQSGKEWSEILLKSARKEFDEYRNLNDPVELGRKLIQARQALIEMEEKVNKTYNDMNKHFQETKNVR